MAWRSIKTILMTGATDGIGRQAALEMILRGQTVVLHGRDAGKLAAVADEGALPSDTILADLSCIAGARKAAQDMAALHDKIDVIINNAGVFKADTTRTKDGLDLRFAINTYAPYVITRALLPHLAPGGRIINVSSAVQAPVDLGALAGDAHALSDMQAYAQSKCALSIWSRALALDLGDAANIIAVNPGSMLATKMVQDGLGVTGKDPRLGSDILRRMAMDTFFDDASGQYFDTDLQRLAQPHPDVLNPEIGARVLATMDATLARIG